MSTKSLSQILSFANMQMSPEAAAGVLREHDSIPLRTILQYCYHPAIKWLLPDGDVPYTPAKDDGLELVLYSEARRLYLFVEAAGVPGMLGLTEAKRQILYIDFLESLDADDAKLIASLKDKRLPYENITPQVVDMAFPGIVGNLAEIPLPVPTKPVKKRGNTVRKNGKEQEKE